MSATLILRVIVSASSVSRIRDLGSACDLDIFDLGSLRDMTRFAGADIISRCR